MTVDMSVFGIIANASNIRHGDNPEYTKEDFLAMYPQFGAADDAGNPQIPDVVMDAWLKMAQAAISKARYGDMWDMAMGFFVAHWLTLYLQTAADADAPVGKIISAGLAKGLQTSKSAGDLSVSYDFSIVADDFDGWGTYKYTMFGQQLITLAKMVSMGGMCVW
jgi:hypothetical protein|nr:MAG TPA: head to tail adaptor [Caudoviricetes sp.]